MIATLISSAARKKILEVESSRLPLGLTLLVCDEKYNLSFLFLFSALEWMALANQLAFSDGQPLRMDSALMNLTTTALELDKVTPFHAYSELRRNLWGLG